MDEIIAKIGGKIVTGIKVAAGFIVARAMAALGLSWVSFEYVLPDVKAFLIDKAQLLPASAVAFFSAIGLDIFIIMIVSAIVAKVGLQVMLVGANKLQTMITNAGG